MIRKNKFSILTALIIMYLSMANSHAFDEVPIVNIPYFDKIVHFGMYFGLMSVIILENRKTLTDINSLVLIALIPMFYGIMIEFMQTAFTLTRTGNFFDALADFAGILVSVFLWLLLKPLVNR